MNREAKLIRRRRPPTVRFCTAVGAFMFVITGCGAPEKEAAPVADVQVAAAQRATIEQVVSAEGVIYPRDQAVITPKITAPIQRLLVQRGSRVRKGQLLAVLENADLTAAAAESSGELQQAEAGYTTTTGASLPQELKRAEGEAAAAKASLNAQQNIYDSRKELFQQGAIPRHDLESAEVSLAQVRTQNAVAQREYEDLKRQGEIQTLKSATGQLDAAKGKYRAAQAQLSYSEIRSPIDGVVTERPQFAGELATANQPLLTVMDLSRVIAKAHIAQSEAALLKPGDTAEIKIAGTEGLVAARVTLVSPALDASSTTVEVWVESAKPNPAIKPGMTVEITAIAKSLDDAIVVPVAAILQTPDGADYLMIAGSDGHAHQKVVSVGARRQHSAQILSGVDAGESVITSGSYALPDNAAIHVEHAPPTESTPEAPSDKSEPARSAHEPEK
jgi:HlyD family secretion protein